MTAVIDVSDCVLGRFSSVVAKRLLNGEKIHIINAEKAVVVGAKDVVLGKFKTNIERGDYRHGPFYPRFPHFIIKRVIRGMVDTKKTRGREAIKRLTVHIGVPGKLEKKKPEVIENSHISKSFSHKYMTLSEISKELGAKWNE